MGQQAEKKKRKKRSETHKRLNRTLFNPTKQDKMFTFFQGILFFKATNNVDFKTKETNKSLS